MSFEAAHLLPRPRDTLRSSTERVQPAATLTIPGIEMLASFSVRRCLDTEGRNNLYESIGITEVIGSMGVTGSGLVCNPGIMIGKRMKSRAGTDDKARLQQALVLQRYCDNAEPLSLQIEKFGAYGDFVSMVPAYDLQLVKDPGVMSKKTGFKGGCSNKSLISIIQSSERAEATKIKVALNETIETPFEVVVGRPVLFSGKTPIVVRQDGVHPTTLI